MALPFLKNRKQSASLIVQNRSSNGGHDTVPEDMDDSLPEDTEASGLEMCAEDLIRAVESKDAQGVAAAMRAAFEILESEPHEESPESMQIDEEII